MESNQRELELRSTKIRRQQTEVANDQIVELLNRVLEKLDSVTSISSQNIVETKSSSTKNKKEEKVPVFIPSLSDDDMIIKAQQPESRKSLKNLDDIQQNITQLSKLSGDNK